MKNYESPKCPHCNTPLLVQRVFHKPKTFAINPEGKVAEVNLTPNLPEALDFENLICAKCQVIFDVVYDKEMRVMRGKKV